MTHNAVLARPTMVHAHIQRHSLLFSSRGFYFFSVGFVPDFFSAAIVSDHKFFGFGTGTKFRGSDFLGSRFSVDPESGRR